jgi:predicted nucleic acid-binding protein
MSGIEFLLDTNMVIGLLKGHAPALLLAEESGLALEKAAVSQITRMELLGYPNLTAEEDQAIRGFLASCGATAASNFQTPSWQPPHSQGLCVF